MRDSRSQRWVVPIVVVFLACGAGLASGGRGVMVVMDEDGRAFTVSVPGVMDLHGGFSATVGRGGKLLVLSSSGGNRHGAGFVFPEDGVELLFRMEQLDGVSGVRVQAGIRNTGVEALSLFSVTPVALEGRVSGNSWEWMVTALDSSVDASPPVVPLSDIRESVDVNEYGGLYRRDGAGFLFGPVGAPIAYVRARIGHQVNDVVSFHYTADMSGVNVQPGETRWGQQVVLLMEPPRVALDFWTQRVAETHGARTSGGALSGWSSSNPDEKPVTSAEVLGVVESVRRSPDRLRPDVIHLDRRFGEAAGRASIPEPPGFYAARIAAVGARPGLTVGIPLAAPGAPVDETVWDALIASARQAVRDGFTYLRVEGTPSPTGAGTEARARTSFEVVRGGFTKLREAVGEETYLLCRGFEPDRATVGLVDASRTGTSRVRDNLRMAIDDMLRSYAIQGRWFAVDNDIFFMKTYGASPMARTWMSMVGLSCGAAITSDPWYSDRSRPHWRNAEVMTPPAKERCEVLDLCTSRHWPRLAAHITRDWGEWTVALLWNPGAAEQSIRLDFADAGMDTEARYAVWSFWENRFLGVTAGSWTAPLLGPAASQHLCFTDLDRDSDSPVLIGSNLHIYCGAAEIKRVSHSRNRMTIELTDAGARQGDLFVYSRRPLVLKAASGCTARAVAGAGENVWRIGLLDRLPNAAQRLELGVILPAHLQAWFWMLIATVMASLLFSAWRYMVALKIGRKHALEHERTRIAGDIHDEVGANLTQISILGTLASRATTAPEAARGYSLEMVDVARETIQSLEEIVWSINPKSDSVTSVAHFVCRRAEELMEAGKVECRITLDEALPDRMMQPRRRHGLLLAFKEALHNILKHSGATHVQVRCAMDGQVFEVVVTDDGRGFDTSVAPDRRAGHGNGLENMRRRLVDIGGECHIESSPGKGTRVTFRLPLNLKKRSA